MVLLSRVNPNLLNHLFLKINDMAFSPFRLYNEYVLSNTISCYVSRNNPNLVLTSMFFRFLPKTGTFMWLKFVIVHIQVSTHGTLVQGSGLTGVCEVVQVRIKGVCTPATPLGVCGHTGASSWWTAGLKQEVEIIRIMSPACSYGIISSFMNKVSRDFSIFITRVLWPSNWEKFLIFQSNSEKRILS